VQVALVLEHTFFMLGSAPKDIAVPVMSNLLFAPNLRQIAQNAVQRMKAKTGSENFNGIHLRVEEDASIFTKKVCAVSLLLSSFVKTAGRTLVRMHMMLMCPSNQAFC
jgi:hypothetical protein